MARWRRCAYTVAMVASFGACCRRSTIALCSRCHGTLISGGAAHQAAAVGRTVHGSFSCMRGAWAWSAPAGSGGQAHMHQANPGKGWIGEVIRGFAHHEALLYDVVCANHTR